MSLFSFMNIAVFSLSLSETLLVHLSNPRDPLHRLLALYLLVFTAQWLIVVGYACSHSFEEACFFWQIDNIWPVIGGVFLPFVLAFVQRAETRGGRVLLGFHIVVTFFLVIVESSTDLITGPPVPLGGGWTFSINAAMNLSTVERIFAALPLIWWCYIAVTINLLLFRFYFSTAVSREKKQTLFLLVGTFITVASAFVLPSLYALGLIGTDLLIYDFCNWGGAVSNIVFAYGFCKYGDNRFSDSRNAHSSPAILLVCSDGTIAYANASASHLLGYSARALRGTPLEAILLGAPFNISGVVCEAPIEIPLFDAGVKTQSGRERPVSVSGVNRLGTRHNDLLLFVYSRGFETHVTDRGDSDVDVISRSRHAGRDTTGCPV